MRAGVAGEACARGRLELQFFPGETAGLKGLARIHGIQLPRRNPLGKGQIDRKPKEFFRIVGKVSAPIWKNPPEVYRARNPREKIILYSARDKFWCKNQHPGPLLEGAGSMHAVAC